jgi:hypothetical protein
VTDLEQVIRAAGETIRYPETPDVERAVVARIRTTAPKRRRRLPWLGRPGSRAVAVAIAAAVLVAASAVAAVPSARSALWRFLHLGGVRVERLDRLPALTPAGPLDLGRETTLSGARHVVDFELIVPRLEVPPRVFARAGFPRGGQVSFLIGSLRRPRLLLTEFRGSGSQRYADKLVGPGTTVDLLRVNGSRGMWVHGRPHLFHFVQADGRLQFEPLRLATNTLIWQQGALTLRLEARVEKDRALEIAAKVR